MNCDACGTHISNKYVCVKCCGFRMCISSGCIIKKCTECGERMEPNLVEMIYLGRDFSETINMSNQNYNQKFYGITPSEACILYKRYEFLEEMISLNLIQKDDKSLMTLAIKNNDLFVIKKLRDNGHVFEYQTSYQILDDFPYLTFEEAEAILKI